MLVFLILKKIPQLFLKLLQFCFLSAAGVVSCTPGVLSSERSTLPCMVWDKQHMESTKRVKLRAGVQKLFDPSKNIFQDGEFLPLINIYGKEKLLPVELLIML